MRRVLCILLCIAMVFGLSACRQQPSERINPITFYYRNAQMQYGSDASALYGLDVDLENLEIPISEIVSLYLEGPDEPFLESPFPPGIHLVSYDWHDNLLTLVLSDSFNSLIGLDRSYAMACLTLTLTQVNGIDGILVHTEDGAFSYLNDRILTREDFILHDLGGASSEISINLYFADQSGTFLLLDSRNTVRMEAEDEARFIVEELILGPEKSEMYPVLPNGIKLRSVSIDNGICTVDYSYDFLEMLPQNAREERIAIYSVVNSLTELDDIDWVQFTVNGQRLGYYLYYDLSAPIERDETAIGPIRSGLNEFQATLFGSSDKAGRLVRQTMRLRRPASQTMAEVALAAQLAWSPPSGLTNPIPSGTRVISVSEVDGVCYVDLSSDFLAVQGNENAEKAAVRAIVSCLCQLSTIRRVSITIEGKTEGLDFVDLSQKISVQSRWSAE